MFDRVVLIGDPLQLGPFYKNKEIIQKNYNTSLFENIVNQNILNVHKLIVQ